MSGVDNWWNNWWQEDFSWTGLKVREFGQYKHLTGATDLQEYWRYIPDGRTASGELQWRGPLSDNQLSAEGLLVHCTDGRSWHIAHIPKFMPVDGKVYNPKVQGSMQPVQAWKRGNWPKFIELFHDMLSHTKPTDLLLIDNGAFSLDECDGRAIFDGLMWFDSDFSILQAGKNAEGLNVSFSNCYISNPHIKADFSSPANFYKSRLTGKGIQFADSSFRCGGNFSSVHFEASRINFYRAEMSGKRTSFANAIFGGEIYFGTAVFNSEETKFTGARFHEIAKFNKCRFGGGSLLLSQVEFRGSVEFSGATIEPSINAEQSRFIGENVDFSDCRFLGEMNTFHGAQFSGEKVSFANATFAKKISMRECIFKASVSFHAAVFPQSISGYQSGFAGAEFMRPINIFGVKPVPISAFNDAILNDSALLDDRSPASEKHDFRKILAQIRNDVEEDEESELAGSARDSGDWFERGAEARFGALERGAQVLKKSMEERSDVSRAQRFFEYELRARNQRPSVSRATKLFTNMYGILSDYGSSVVRPIILFAAMTFMPLGIYYCMYISSMQGQVHFAWGGKIDPDLLNAGMMAFKNMVKPFDFWRGDFGVGQTGWLNQWLKNQPEISVLYLLIATIQSLFSIVSIFLLALALRRKFQLS